MRAVKQVSNVGTQKSRIGETGDLSTLLLSGTGVTNKCAGIIPLGFHCSHPETIQVGILVSLVNEKFSFSRPF